jgi:hypothetical protein
MGNPSLCRRSAATLLSTPPDIATRTRSEESDTLRELFGTCLIANGPFFRRGRSPMVKRPVHCTDFRRPYRAMVARDLTQAKAWAMLSWPFGPQNHRGARGCPNRLADGPKGQENSAQALAGFSLGKHKKTSGPVGAGETRWFTEVNVTRNSTTFLVRRARRWIGWFLGLKPRS